MACLARPKPSKLQLALLGVPGLQPFTGRTIGVNDDALAARSRLLQQLSPIGRSSAPWMQLLVQCIRRCRSARAGRREQSALAIQTMLQAMMKAGVAILTRSDRSGGLFLSCLGSNHTDVSKDRVLQFSVQEPRPCIGMRHMVAFCKTSL